jgi:PAS domain S-box-containing protein
MHTEHGLSDSLYRAAVENSYDLITLLSQEGTILYESPSVSGVLGHPPQSLVGTSVFALVHPDDLEPLRQEFASSLTGAGRQATAFRFRTRSGEWRWLESTGAVLDAAGATRAVVVTARDVTDRVRAAESASQRLANFQGIFEAVPEGIVIHEDGRFVNANPAFLEMVGYTSREIEGFPITRVVSPASLPVVQAHTRAQSTASYVAEIVRKDGTLVPVEVVGKPFFCDGRPARLAVVRDISLRQRAQSLQSYFTAVVQSTEDAVIGSCANAVVTHWNPGAQKLLGYAPEEILGQPFEVLLPPDERAASPRAWAAHFSSSRQLLVETALVGKDGSPVVVSLRSTLVRSDSGEVLGSCVVARDITEQKRAQEAQMRLATIIESSNDAIWSMDHEGKLTFWNHGAEQLYGYACEEVLGQSISLLAVPGHADEITQMVERVLRGERIRNLEARRRCKDGCIIDVSVSVSPMSDASGRITGASAIARDITELRRSREEMQKAHDDLERRVHERTLELEQANHALSGQIAERQMAMGGLREVLVQLERAKAEAEQANEELRHSQARLLQGNLVFAAVARLQVAEDTELEETLRRITEASAGLMDVERCSIWLFSPSRSELRCLDLFERSQQRHTSGQELSEKQYPHYFQALEAEGFIVADDAHTHPGTNEFSQSYLAPLGITSMLDTAITVGGRTTGILCHEHLGQKRSWEAHDLTLANSGASMCALVMESRERSRSEAALIAAKEEADKANAAKSEFLSRMSHELRTPLNAILGFGQVLEIQDLTPLQSESVSHILKGGDLLLALINEVLDISRIEAGHVSLSLEPVLLADVVGESIDMVRPLSPQYSVHVAEGPSELDQQYVLADRQRLKQVLLNLLANAIKYNRPQGQVWFSHHLNQETSLLSIHDTGTGISPEDQQRVFLPFERAGTDQESIEGTGLGLALCCRLMKLMGGTVSVESTLGRGSTFTLELPVAQSPMQQMGGLDHENVSQTRSETPSDARRVLLIEDNLSNLRLIETILSDRPRIQLITAMQGSLGLELARQNRPDLVLLDVHLPDTTGDQVLLKLRQDPLTHAVPVVVVSADATSSQREKLLAAGANDYLTKPLNVRGFLRVLDALLADAPH